MGRDPCSRLPHYMYAYYLWARSLGRRKGESDKCVESNEGGLPVPPPHLRYRVHGAADAGGFLRVGKSCANCVTGALQDNGYRLEHFRRVLDFGCGCGRVARFLGQGIPAGGSTLWGTDIDRQAIRWCRRNLPFGNWSVNEDLPPTAYQNDFFDFVYAISVFTHLHERFQNEWLKEIHRILKPGGLFLASVHGEAFEDNLKGDQTARVQREGTLTTVGRTGSLKLDGLPDYYQTTFHRREYIERTWGKLFSILEYRPKGMNRRQDAVLMRKGPAARRWTQPGPRSICGKEPS